MSKSDPARYGNAAATALGVLAMAALIGQFVEAFGKPLDMANPAYGTAAAPYSDALAPWLVGGLSFLFGVAPPSYVYRPTIGVFWSSILAATERFEMIPVLFAGCLLGFLLLALLVLRDAPLRTAIAVWLTVAAVSFAQTFATLYIATTNVDLAALFFSACGVILLLWKSHARTESIAMIAVASLALGVAAALRGPMILGGPVMIAVAALVGPERKSKSLLWAGLAFVLPIVVDLALQRHFELINNGIVGLFCVYSDPAHFWSPQCHVAYLAQKLSAQEVFRGYLAFAFSASGFQLFFNNAAWRVTRDLAVLQQPIVIAALVGGSLLALASCWRTPVTDSASFESAYPGDGRIVVRAAFRWAPLLRLAFVAGSLLLAMRMESALFSGSLAWLVLMLAVTAGLRLWRPFLCFAGYSGGTIFLCLIGLHVDRLEATFAFTVYVGVTLFISELHSGTTVAGRETRSAMPALGYALLALIAFLYLGNFVVRSELRDRYRNDVLGKQGRAIKISDDASVDRSLYYAGDGGIIYTRHDDRAIGEVRSYRGLATQESGNGSFRQPNAFVD